MRKQITKTQKKASPFYTMPGDGMAEAEAQMDHHIQQVRYLQNCAKFPVYSNSKTSYFSPGEDFNRELLTQLEKAQHYIFLEHFIVQAGVMWDAILEILKRKAAQGVKVRVMYDDLGCFFTLLPDIWRIS